MKEIRLKYEDLDSIDDLPAADSELVAEAQRIAEDAYAPYSGFRVGCALSLDSGKIIVGNNQENAAYPSGLCAERTALFHASSNYPGQRIRVLAIAAFKDNHLTGLPVFPCGSCRQVMFEYESRQGSPIRLIFCGKDRVMVIDSVKDILPFAFDKSVFDPD